MERRESESGAVKVGLLGGTFDPIHYGHLAAAEEALWALDLDRVLFAPAALPPHKQERVVTPIDHRLAMVELALRSNPAFGLTRVDVDRPDPAFSVDTVSLVKQELRPGAKIFFIVGLDSLKDILTWRQPERLLATVSLVAMTRPGYTAPDLSRLENIAPGVSERLHIITMPGLEISSSDLRERVAIGRPIKYLLPEAVEAYILQQGLYCR